MTRINCGIPPSELSREHLISEAREMKRIPNKIKSGKYSMNGIPKKFKLGTGHMKFFYNKLGYLLKRYKAVREEGLKRGYNMQDFSSAWEGVPDYLMGDYTPTDEDREIVKERIKERLENTKQK